MSTFEKYRERLGKRRADAQFQLVLSTPKLTDVCVEYGANVGDAALFAEAGCTMHAFESEPACFWMHGRFRRPKARN